MTYAKMVNRNACLRGGIDDGGSAAADMRKWEQDILSDESLMVIAESVGIHPSEVQQVLELAMNRQEPNTPWLTYAAGLSTRPQTPKPRWLQLNFAK